MYADGNGLYLQISEAGTKNWGFRFRHQSKRRDMGLGALVDVGLASARAKTFESRRLLLRGIDPIKSRAAARGSARGDQVTFRQPFETFFEVKRKSLSNAKHLRQWPSTMSTYVFPFIWDQPVADVQTAEILELLTPIWFDKPETAKRVLAEDRGGDQVSDPAWSSGARVPMYRCRARAWNATLHRDQSSLASL